MMTIASLVLSIAALVLAVHAAIFSAWIHWLNVNLQLLRAGERAAVEARDQSPPWYVRYSRWLPGSTP